MGYAHIDNLYKNKTILLFKECIAMEKVHGTSTHIAYEVDSDNITFFNGGFHAQVLETLFDVVQLKEKIKASGLVGPSVKKIIFYGEGYGGNMQKMSHIYGQEKRFICFDIKIVYGEKEEGRWLGIIDAQAAASSIGLEFVPFRIIPATIEAINEETNKPSVVAQWRGCGEQLREGVVVRPVIEISVNGGRVVAKNKSEKYKELMEQPKVDPHDVKVKLEADASKIAENWVTPMRLAHVLDKFPTPHTIEIIKDVILAMNEDVMREGEGEIDKSNPKLPKMINSRTASIYKEYLLRA